MLCLSRRDVEAALQPAACMAAMAEALSGLAEGSWQQPPRRQFAPSGTTARMGLMPAFRDGPTPLFAVKDVMLVPGNRSRGLDTHQGVVVLHDGTDGRVLAVVDATALTALRTAAVSALAIHVLARPGVTEVGLLGTGAQARAHAATLRCVLPGARFRVWGRDPARAAHLAEEIGGIACATVADALRGADVACTLTAARTPLLSAVDVPPGCHIDAVGNSAPDARELAGDLVASATRFVDSRVQAAGECGEFILAAAEGLLPPGDAPAELGEVLSGRRPGRTGTDEVTLFKSLGLAVEDLAVAALAVREAKRLGLGTTVA